VNLDIAIDFNTDIDFLKGDVKKTDALYNAYVLSIFTDELQWFGDRKLGSRLYQFRNIVITDIVIEDVKQAIKDCIKWIKDDGLVLSQDVNVWQDDTAVKFTINAILPNNSKFTLGFEL